MQAVLPTDRNWPLHGAERSREIERAALAASPPFSLMHRAGAAVARLALALAPHARQAWIAAGPGNNGGDGLEAAIGLRQAGKSVRVTLLADAARLPTDAAQALQRAQAAGVPISTEFPHALDDHDVAVDALLGIGANRAPGGALAQAVARLNALPCAVLAIDLPSGLDGSTGRLLHDEQTPAACAVRASHTLSLLTLKPGLFTAAGRDHSGAVWFDTLGVTPDDSLPDAWLAGTGSFDLLLRPRLHDRHKGSYGDVLIIGGASGMSGAAILAARAAHAAGAGRVHVSFLDANAARNDPVRPELMIQPASGRARSTLLADAVTACGCGGGEAVRRVLPEVLGRARWLVLDADALNAVAADSALRTQLAARAPRGHATLLTPHPLEAARMLGCSTAQVQADRLGAAAQLAQQCRSVVVLKGSGSIVAAPAQVPFINPTGNAALASAGTGDVLAGWIAGLWTQHVRTADCPDEATRLAWRAALGACHVHGAAADTAQRVPLRAGDLIEQMHLLQSRRSQAHSS